MSAAGAVETLVRTESEWAEYLQQNPGDCYEPELKPPFYVLSRVISQLGEPAEYLHHKIGPKTAHEILQAELISWPFIPGFIDGIVIEEPTVRGDARGHVVELFRKDDLVRRTPRGQRAELPAMAYLSVTKPGVLRGPHEHFTQTDMFTFCPGGTFTVWLWDNRKNSSTYWRRFSFRPNNAAYTTLIVPPGVVHAYRADVLPGTIINHPDVLYAGWNKRLPVDEVRHELSAMSPFQIWEEPEAKAMFQR